MTEHKQKRQPRTTATHTKRLLPDTSVVADALVTKYIKDNKIKPETILIHHAVLNELEHQANSGREIGYIGLDEIKELQEGAGKNYKIEFIGERPGEFEIKFAKSGAVDHIIRQAASDQKATLMTADRVQALVAEAQGIPVVFVQFDRNTDEVTDPLKEYFTEDTMSLHLKEDSPTVRKRGKPGEWKFEELRHTPSFYDMQELAKEIVEAAQWRRDSFIEIERKGSSIVQLGSYRIVIVRPPFGSSWEVTAVRPVAYLELKDYAFPEKFQKRLEEHAEGILVAGSPGEGKSTFTQALGSFYASKEKIVKTVEAPRDLVLPKGITQYSASHGSPEEIRDVLLLNRPDYTIYDEIRNNKDFQLFADMRMAGVGMIGVVHATAAVDAIQRFIGRIEMGMVPSVIDTVVFIKAGKIAKVQSLTMQVKVPAGMTEADLARPVIVIKDFYTDTAEYEIYTYGDQIAVIPVKEQKTKKTALQRFAEEGLEEYFAQYSNRVKVEMVSENKIIVRVPENRISQIIGKGGSIIQSIEEDLGLSIDVQELTGGGDKKKDEPTAKTLRWEANISRTNIVLDLPSEYSNKEIHLYDKGNFLMSMTASKKGQVKLTLNSPPGQTVKKSIDKGQLEIRS